MSKLRRLLAALATVASVPALAMAQENAVVTGRVTNASGGQEAAVAVRIVELNAGTNTVQDGTYRLVIPGNRLPASRNVTITASRQGLETASRTITLGAGSQVTQNFQLGASAISLQGVVVTALGIERTRRSLSYSAQAVEGSDLNKVPESNV